ncbi:MAG: RecQ family ATP-dependent DNA helicase [Bacteroidetes bacterium]|nr:MAG: RecQ family ATP-dependent DNA helicase [Bacteroidota bacterium]
MNQIHSILKEYWGYDNFRPLQEDIIQSVLKGQDTLALLPTGGGKSICFQVPAMAQDGLCLVISPLIALMKDQVENLQKRGIPALAIYSGMSHREMDRELDNCIHGQYKFLYVSPERLHTELFKARAVQMKINLLAIDEAHCISQWGYDFRPEYLRIAEVREWLKAPVLALTASATQAVVDDIQVRLSFKERHVFRKSFERKNLHYLILQEENKLDRILQIVSKIKGSGVIYARNRRLCKDLAEYLYNHGHSVDFYHAGLDGAQRSRKQENWINGKTRIMVSTNAFGMGIDKPDVRFVIHYELPDSLEAYYQEAGRAGRDEKAAYCIALFRDQDKQDALRQWEQSYPPYEEVARVYTMLCNHLQIPLHSGAYASYDFDIAEFAKKNELKPSAAFQCLKVLEQESVLHLSDALHQPAKVHIKVDNTVMYDFELRNPKIAGFLKLLLRSYAGLFDQYVRVDEAFLARQLHHSVEEIKQVFMKLQEVGLVSYEPAKDKPQVVLLRPREDKVHYVQENQKELKHRAGIRLEAVFGYAENQHCRSQTILEYFNELDSPRCGQCDICQADQKEKKSEEAYRVLIQQALEKGHDTLKDLTSYAGYWHEEHLSEVLRHLIDEGLITLHPDQRITWNEGNA